MDNMMNNLDNSTFTATPPKKRGRKPKNAVVPEVEKFGKLNISIIEDEDTSTTGQSTAEQVDKPVTKQKKSPAKKSPAKSTNSPSIEKQQQQQQQQQQQIESTPPEGELFNLDITASHMGNAAVNRRPAVDDKPGYFQILREFNDAYPQQTNIHCWWCCHQFDSHPIGIPTKYDKISKTYKVIGCFCSFECAFAHCRDKNKKVYLSDFRVFYEKVTGEDGRHILSIRPAPDKWILKMFGGELSIEEFRASFTNGTRFQIMCAPMVPIGMFCDESKVGNRVYKKDGVIRKLEIRKAKKKPEPVPEEILSIPKSAVPPVIPQILNLPASNVAKKKSEVIPNTSPQNSKRTTVTQLISFG